MIVVRQSHRTIYIQVPTRNFLMKKSIPFLYLSLVLGTSITPAFALTEAELNAYLRKQPNQEVLESSESSSSLCQDRWKNDYVMLEYCQKEQEKAYGRIRGNASNLCRQRWGNDYVMLEYCQKEQEKAYGRIRVNASNLCRQRWGNDYVMLEYCTNEQDEARNRIGQ